MCTDCPGRWFWRVAGLICNVPLLLAVTGCDDVIKPGGSPMRARGEGFAGDRLVEVNLDAVRPVADRAFRQYFRVDPAASSANTWISRPTETSEHGDTETPRVRTVLSGAKNRRRQLAELHLAQDGSDVVARCRVQTQRLDTEERAAFAPGRGDDRPSDTPIDRSGPSASRVREEWVNVGRDRKTERLILDAIQEKLSPTK